jgi:hypothetical protein
MTSLLFAALVAAAPITADEFGERAKKLLIGFGVPGAQVASVYKGDSRSGCVVNLTDKRGRSYVVRLDSRGRVAGAVLARAYHGGHQTLTVSDPRYGTMVRRWYRALDGDPEVRLEEIQTDGSGVARARLSITRFGRPFVAFPDYKYEFQFKIPSGDFVALWVHEGPPKVERVMPKISKEQAIAALKPRPATTRPATPNYFKHVVQHTKTHPPELAYYIPYGQTKPILAWRTLVWNFRDAAHKRRETDSEWLIDANTGQRLPHP